MEFRYSLPRNVAQLDHLNKGDCIHGRHYLAMLASHSLRRAIDSALGQGYSDIEVIVSDNASTDETEAICQRYSRDDAHFKYIRQQINLGPTWC